MLLVTLVTAAAVIALQRMSRGGAAAPRQRCGLILRGRPGVYEGLRSWGLHLATWSKWEMPEIHVAPSEPPPLSRLRAQGLWAQPGWGCYWRESEGGTTAPSLPHVHPCK